LGEKLPGFIKHSKICGGAGKIKNKTRTPQKAFDFGATCMIVGYETNH
jgi:hypothetical protein